MVGHAKWAGMQDALLHALRGKSMASLSNESKEMGDKERARTRAHVPCHPFQMKSWRIHPLSSFK